MSITEPLRLAVGSHGEGSGKGCAMNVISWESGEKEITDFPACADSLLARMVQDINDRYCPHRFGIHVEDRTLLCPPCSMEVLALAHRTVGTNIDARSDIDPKKLYIKLALERIKADINPTPHDRGMLNLVEAYLNGELSFEIHDHVGATHDEYKRRINFVETEGMPVDVVSPNQWLRMALCKCVLAVHDVLIDGILNSLLYAVSSSLGYSNVVDQDGKFGASVEKGHKTIDLFEELTGVRATPVPEEVTAAACSAMATIK